MPVLRLIRNSITKLKLRQCQRLFLLDISFHDLGSQCGIQQFFQGTSFSTSVARRKILVQLGSLWVMRDTLSPQALPSGVQGQIPEKFWLFCILNSSKHCPCGSATTNGDESFTLHFHIFESLGVWVWDPKPLHWLQNSSGYGSGWSSFIFMELSSNFASNNRQIYGNKLNYIPSGIIKKHNWFHRVIFNYLNEIYEFS